MAPADDLDASAKASPLYGKYGTRVDNESAREKLAARTEAAAAQAAPEAEAPVADPVPTPQSKKAASAAAGGVDALGSFLKSSQGKKLENQVIRGVFGMLRKSLSMADRP